MLLRPIVGPTIRRMHDREAEDFLVQDAAKQAMRCPVENENI